MIRFTVRDLLAKGHLKKLGANTPDVGVQVLAALGDDDWKVRRNALRFLDHAPVAGMEPKIIDLLQDEEAEVRKWAAHALGCDRCKDGAPLAVDPVPYLITAAENDPSILVRRSAVVCLAWNRPQDRRIDELLAKLASASPDQKIRSHARSAMAYRATRG